MTAVRCAKIATLMSTRQCVANRPDGGVSVAMFAGGTISTDYRKRPTVCVKMRLDLANVRPSDDRNKTKNAPARRSVRRRGLSCKRFEDDNAQRATIYLVTAAVLATASELKSNVSSRSSPPVSVIVCSLLTSRPSIFATTFTV